MCFISVGILLVCRLISICDKASLFTSDLARWAQHKLNSTSSRRW